MKKFTIFMVLVLIILTGCSNEDGEIENNNSELNNNPTQNVVDKKEDNNNNNNNNNNKQENIEIEVKQEKVLKDATQEEINEIIEGQIEEINTKTSNYPFFEQATMQEGNMEEIKKAGGMEVTSGQIYLLGLGDKYNVFSSLLTDEEKETNFYKKGGDFSFYYTDLSKEEILKKIKENVGTYKLMYNEGSISELELTKNNITYSVRIAGKNDDNTPRDEFDFILRVMDKTKVIISKLELN